MIVVGGDFSVVGDRPARSLAMWEPGTDHWQEVAGGIDGSVHSLKVLANGDLAVGGTFVAAGNSVPANSIATTDGANWTSLGAGVASGRVDAIVEYAGGLAIGGQFPVAGGLPCSNVAWWDGSSWNNLGQGVDDAVNALAVDANGRLLIGGVFQVVDGVTRPGLVSWDGTSYDDVGGGVVPAHVLDMEVADTGAVYVSGNLRLSGVGNTRFASFDGSAWTSYTSWQVGILLDFDLTPAGVVATSGTALMEWDGTSWTSLGQLPGNSAFYTIVQAANGTTVVGGSFRTISGAPASNLAQRPSGSWQPLYPGGDGRVQAFLELPNGDTLVGGSFRLMGGAAAMHIARFDGTAWHALPGGPDRDIRDIEVLPGGDLVTAGSFGMLNGQLFGGLARWDGANWSDIGPLSLPGHHTLTSLPDGRLLVGGYQRLSAYDGNTLVAVTPQQPNSNVFDVLASSDQDIVIAGDFTMIGSLSAWGVARWDGQSWSAFGSGANAPVHQVAYDRNGDLIASGHFTLMGGVVAVGIARWDGAAWHAIGANTEPVTAMAILPNDDLIVARRDSQRLARWDGAAWSDVPDIEGQVVELEFLGAHLAVGGTHVANDGAAVTSFYSRLVPTCPPTQATVVAGCGGAAGVPQLAVRDAWVGGLMVEAGSQLPQPSLVVTVHGFTPANLALGNLLPQAGPNCVLGADPLSLGLLTAFTGSAASELLLPNEPSIAGAMLYSQWIALEVDSALNVLEVSATAAVASTIGVF